MGSFRLIVVLLLLAAAGRAAEAQVVVRLKGGWPISSGELKEKYVHYPEWTSEFKNSGSSTFAAELSFWVPKLPFDLALDAGRHLFEDDSWGKIQETSYEYPEGSGRYTDFYHRIYSLSLKLELPVALAYRAVTTLGAGWGWYFYKYVNLGDYQPDFDWLPSHSNPGWQLSLTQTVDVYDRLGVLFAFEYHSFSLDDSDRFGAAPIGAINRINFYCIHLGLSFRVVN